MQIFYKLRRKTVPVDSEIGTIPSTGLSRSPKPAAGAGKAGKKQNAAAQTSQQDEPPELAIRLPQDEQKDRQTYGLTVEQVQRRRQSGVPQPYRPQQVVQDPGAQTQQNRQEERAELLRDMDGHGLSEQTAEKAALTVRSVLIGDGGDAAIHIQLAPL